MKKYCFLIVIMSAMLFSACEQKENSEYVYHVSSPLTTMTTTKIIPEDTYSEYMETYTSVEFTESNSCNYYVPLPDIPSDDISVNTFLTAESYEIPSFSKDTAAAMVIVKPVDNSEMTETVVAEAGKNENAEVTEKNSETKFNVTNTNKPPFDTAYHPEISEDTRQTGLHDETPSDEITGE